jgi:hypothetical protein
VIGDNAAIKQIRSRKRPGRFQHPEIPTAPLLPANSEATHLAIEEMTELVIDELRSEKPYWPTIWNTLTELGWVSVREERRGLLDDIDWLVQPKALVNKSAAFVTGSTKTLLAKNGLSLLEERVDYWDRNSLMSHLYAILEVKV